MGEVEDVEGRGESAGARNYPRPRGRRQHDRRGQKVDERQGLRVYFPGRWVQGCVCAWIYNSTGGNQGSAGRREGVLHLEEGGGWSPKSERCNWSRRRETAWRVGTWYRCQNW